MLWIEIKTPHIKGFPQQFLGEIKNEIDLINLIQAITN